MIGIYSIINVINGKRYIGQSKDISKRWKTHKKDLNANNHHNRHLQYSWNKYGSDSFKFEIVEECDISAINEREQYWIKYYKAHVTEFGYNLDIGGAGALGYKHTDEEIEKMRRIQSPNIVLQFDKDFKFVHEWTGGVSHISKTLRYTKECILLRCDHRIKEMSLYKESYWVYKEEYDSENFTWDNYLNNKMVITLNKKSQKECKRICQYTEDGELVKIWDSYKDLRNAGFNASQISGICYQSRGKKRASGYICCFEGYDFTDGYFDSILKRNVKTNSDRQVKSKPINYDHSSKTIEQYDTNGNLINTYNSLTEAAKTTGFSRSQISRSALGKLKDAWKGYFWKYV